jgi:hypothetical protein
MIRLNISRVFKLLPSDSHDMIKPEYFMKTDSNPHINADMNNDDPNSTNAIGISKRIFLNTIVDEEINDMKYRLDLQAKTMSPIDNIEVKPRKSLAENVLNKKPSLTGKVGKIRSAIIQVSQSSPRPSSKSPPKRNLAIDARPQSAGKASTPLSSPRKDRSRRPSTAGAIVRKTSLVRENSPMNRTASADEIGLQHRRLVPNQERQLNRSSYPSTPVFILDQNDNDFNGDEASIGNM